MTRDTLTFTSYFYKKRFNRRYIVAQHHRLIAEALDKVLRGEITRLMINIFPRSGKTELAVKNFIAQGFAINPASKFIHLTYSNELALDNSEEIRDAFIQNEEYQRIFPFVRINKASTAKNKWYTTAGGGMYAAAAGGAITGFGAGSIDDITDEELGEIMRREPSDKDLGEFLKTMTGTTGFDGAIIIDDPLKPDDAFSDISRARVNRRWLNTIKSRLNSIRTPVIVIGQRLHPDDFCGHILEVEGEEWEVLNIPALYYEGEEPRSIWESKMPVVELLRFKKQDGYTFESQYQQNPTSAEGLLLPLSEMLTYDPDSITFTQEDCCMMAIDPADKGDDFAAPAAYIRDGYIYIDEWICNASGLDINIPAAVGMAKRRKPASLHIESNGGWIQTAKDIREGIYAQVPETYVLIYNSHENKEARIEAQAFYIRNRCLFRKDWQTNPDYAAAVKCITSYVRGQKNKKDDAIDILSKVIAEARKNNII